MDTSDFWNATVADFYLQTHLAWIAVNYSNVSDAKRTLQVDFLHICPLHLKMKRRIVVVCNHKSKFFDISQNFLTDSFAGTVYADFHPWTRKQHCRAKHGDTDCFAKPAWSRNQYLLRNMIPSVCLQDFLMISCKLTRWFKFPEAACACFQKIIMTV